MNSKQQLQSLIREILISLHEEDTTTENEEDLTFNDGSGERQKYSSPDSSMGAMMS